MAMKCLYNARIYTGLPERPWASSLIIAGERVLALDQESFWRGAPGVESEDMEGALLLPGFTDAHFHFAWYAMSLQQLDFQGVTNRAAVLEKVQERARELPRGEWIQGRGWDNNLWEDNRFLTRDELDLAAPEHPVLLVGKSAHVLVANRRALQAAGITAQTPDPPGGRIGRDADGRPNGLFFDAAMDLMLRAVPMPSAEVLLSALRHAQTRLLEQGVTAIHDMDKDILLAPYAQLRERGELQLRIVKYLPVHLLDEIEALGLQAGFGDDWVRVGGVKLFADGALGSRTAALFMPYEGEPHNTGLLWYKPEELTALVQRITNAGLAVALHAIGDRANRLALNALQAARRNKPQLRHRLEHVQLLDREDVVRLSQLGVVASMQPIHAVHDWRMAEQYWGERCALAYAWSSLADQGTVLAFGSDAPIEPFNPLWGLYAAVTRRDVEGTIDAAGWHPEQRLELRQAVRAYTWGAAYAAGMESRSGWLGPGALADLVVLDRDIFSLPPEALLETRIRRTMVGGTWRWSE